MQHGGKGCDLDITALSGFPRVVTTARNQCYAFVQLLLGSLVNHAIAEVHAEEEVAHEQNLPVRHKEQQYKDEQSHHRLRQHDGR